jgi:hypothetical protein
MHVEQNRIFRWKWLMQSNLSKWHLLSTRSTRRSEKKKKKTINRMDELLFPHWRRCHELSMTSKERKTRLLNEWEWFLVCTFDAINGIDWFDDKRRNNNDMTNDSINRLHVHRYCVHLVVRRSSQLLDSNVSQLINDVRWFRLVKYQQDCTNKFNE